ncbi:sensor histidine kinase [Paenibacillus cymbidii]|uniref:sensor histidine kinase n=1 Tax=Paenibacillus cymbidii TaxID=1639034 RepID=UPI001081DEA3|nr:histidine kinase [Paenibacillus cymbidii]
MRTRAARWKLTIFAKMFIVSVALILAMILLVNFLYYQDTRSTLLTNQIEDAKQFTDKSNAYLNLNLKNIQSFFLSVARDNRLKSGDYAQFNQWLNDNLILFIPNSKGIHLMENGTVVASSSQVGWLLDEDNEFKKQTAGIAKPNQIFWSKPYYSAVSGYTVSAMMQIPLEPQKKTLLLTLDLDLPKLFDSLIPNGAASKYGKLLLLDSGNQPIYGSETFVRYDSFAKRYELRGIDGNLFSQTWLVKEESNRQNSYLFVRSNDNLLSWQVVRVIDKTELLKPLQKKLDYIGLLTLLSLALSSIIAYTLSRFFGNPIRVIARSMDKVGLGHWDTQIDVTRNDELGLLAQHFNRMTAKIRDLIEELKQTEKAKQQSDFLAFQTQIRPHFIFNTLNSISMAAREAQPEKVDRLISSFTETIHYTLDYSPSPVTLREELQALASYIFLMQIRYNHIFSLETDIEPSTEQLLLPKFTLQPIVENAIFHGFAPVRKKGTLFIGTERVGETWELMIEDSGNGMSEEQLAALLDRLERHPAEPGGHIGLRNVHSRLKLMYGDAYRMKIESRTDQGTRVILAFPVRGQEGGDKP